ncbi:GNAT family N-acetyltransferase, partial [Kribbella sp.]|uniref:GNAT family N-acetyltransferase n=1 Tax=Kribbella sp. TaxID=1871183 RepID=UPI002D4ACAAF
GSITLRPAADELWLEHFYLDPRRQGQGLGTAVLRTVLDGTDAPVRLNVLRGSKARKLYERHGFVVENEDPVDIFMVRKFP